MTNRTLHGIINGRTIELSEDPGMPPGQHVDIAFTSASAKQSSWGDGLRRSAGALSDEWTDDDDRILESIYRERNEDRRCDRPA